MSQKSVIGWSCLYCGLLGCISVGHWLVFPAGVTEDYRNVYHMISSTQGFLSGLIVISCFLFLPQKLGEQAPGKVFRWLAFLTPAGTSVSAWFRFAFRDEIMLAVSMGFWMILVLTLLAYCYPLLKNQRKATDRTRIFWFGCAFVFGATGTCLVSIYSTLQIVIVKEIPWILFLGRGYLLQGMPLAIFIAIILPVVHKFSNESHATTSLWPNILFLFILTISIPLEFWLSPRLGFALRAAVLLFVFGSPKTPGTPAGIENRLFWIIWLAMRIIPIGYVVALIDPELRESGLHVVLVTGITLGLLTYVLKNVQEHVQTQSHPLLLPGFLLALCMSVLLRAGADIDIERQIIFLNASAMSFVVGIILWVITVFSTLTGKKD